jgi:hypothetical protein
MSVPDEKDIPKFVDEKDRYVEIYKIINTVNQKIYVGQAVSHIKNHGKFRRYGSIKRFSSHVSEAITNNKDKQCFYLNNAIRKYGSDKFRVKVIDTCSWEKRDEIEAKYINECKSVFPLGYNLKIGGTVFQHTEESRRRLGIAGLKSWDKHKLEKFNNIIIPTDLQDNIENYISYYEYTNRNKIKRIYTLTIGSISVDFGSISLNKEELKKNILEFVNKLVNKRMNIARPADVRETPNPDDDLANKDSELDSVNKDNNDHSNASFEEHELATKAYYELLKQRKEARKFNYICKTCGEKKDPSLFRGTRHLCRGCEYKKNTLRNKEKGYKRKTENN